MPKLYEALAEAFLAEGVDTQFVLMGDGNMHWSTAFAKLPGVHTVHVRHEHATVAAATAYNVATNKIAVASVTCGPGVTQVMTALPAAARARLPMVVFAGESPINAKFYNQYIDQAPLVTATGAHYIAAHSVPRMMDHVREAFHIAKYERRPVVLGIPYDLQKVADIYVRSDALVGVEAILAGLDKKLGVGKPTAAAIRSKELAHRIATEPADSMPFDIAPDVLDPREAIRAIDAVVPKDWDIVVGGGHQAYFNTQMRGRPAERYTTVREFGAVGNGLSYALGVAAARWQGREGKIVLFEGDGGLLFHIQELETIKRQGFRILICAMNDGGYGSEFHKLRADGVDDSLAVFGRPALEKIARGFDLRGHEIRDVSVIPKLFADFAAQGESEMWNIQISDQVTAPVIRQPIKRGHGNRR